jgi:hypothetical protein
MIPNFSEYLNAAFILIIITAVMFLFFAANKSKTVAVATAIWLIIQSALSSTGFYMKGITTPPRFLLMILPPVAFIIILFATKKGRRFIDSFILERLILLNVIRIPVELILFGLFLDKQIPRAMTIEGNNFDIISGITAPLVYFAFKRKFISEKLLLVWNVICLLLVLNVAAYGILSVPGNLQVFAFDQPNKAILNFPFNLLPSFIVPLVIFSHLVCIRRLSFPVKRFFRINAVQET